MALNLKSTRLTPAQLAKKEKKRKLFEQAAQKTADRRTAIKAGDDIALRKVNSVPSQVKRGLGSLATGVVAGVPKMLGNTQVNDVKYRSPLLSVEKRQAAEDELRLQNEKDIQGIRNVGKKLFNLQDTRGEDIAFGLGEAIAPILVPGGLVGKAGKTVFATDGLSKLGTLAARGRQGGAIGLGYTGMAEENPTAKDYIENAALFGAFDVGAAGIGMAGKSLLGKLVKPKAEVKAEAPKVEKLDEVDDFFDLEGEQGIDFTADQFGNVRRGEAQEALPAGEQRLMLQAGQTPKALTGQQPLMLPEGKIPNWEYHRPARFQATPDGKVMDIQEGSFPLAKVEGVDYTPNTGLSGRQRIAQDVDKSIPRSDIGDPAYLAKIEKQYNKIIDDEVAYLKQESGKGVEQGALGLNAEGEVVSRWGRTSNNPEWYQEFWRINGRAPREGELRDIALQNLIEGNRFTGEPANAEFHALLSEMSRGQKLPEEWHALQRSVREMGDDPALAGLAADMKAVQKSVEPYGLNKNIDRLTELENQARQRMKDRADFRKQYPDAIGIVAKNPLDDIKDLTIIGATKIARGTIEFAQWSKEMIDEFGQIIEKQLPGIWKHSNLLVQKGETVLKYKGNEMPVKWQAENAAPKAGNLPGVTNGQSKPKNVTTGAGEANAVKWREGDPLPAPQSKIVMQKPKEGFDFKGAMNKFYTHFVNTQQAIVNTGKAAGSNLGKIASNTRNASGIVDHNFFEAMVDKNGNKVGASLKEVAESIPKGKEEDFWTYMSQRHNIDRAREGKPVQTNYSPEMSTKAVQIAESQNPEFKAAGDAITQWIDKFMQTWGVDTGIVNKDVYTSLREMYPSYFPTQREFSELEKSIPDGLSQKFVDLSSPVQKAKGSDRDITNPLENIAQLVSRTIRTAKYNEVGQSLLESVQKNPKKMKPLAEIVPFKDGMFANADNIISVLVDGKPQYLKINDKPLLDAMNGLPKKIHDVPFVTALTQAVKNTITQKNPLFAIRNIMRDVPTSYVYGSETNPVKFARDLGKAGKDMATNSERFQKYKAVGGSGANFFSSGEASKAAAGLAGQGSKLGKLAKAPLDAIEKFNNLTETAPRLAEFNRVLDKTGDVNEALYAAGEVTVNFSRSGNVTKAVDKWGGMYVNASVQGIDRFFRGFKDPKVALATLVKGGIAITSPDIALYLVNKDNPNYKAIDNRNKDTYFMIPNLADKDENGNAKTFIKVPKSRELGVLFGSLLVRMARAGEGQKDSFKGFANTVVTNFAPANPLESNLITPALINIPRNKDFADRPIVPLGMEMDNRPAYLQYDEKSTEIAKKIGELTKGLPGLEGGLSPKQIDYLVKSYTGVIAQIGQPLATKGGGGSGVGKVLKNQFVADPLFSNQATTDFYDKLGKLSAKATEKNIKQNIPSKEVTPEEDIKNSMNAVSQALSRGTKQINKINATSDPNKEAKIKAIKKKMLFLTDKANKANTAEAMQAVEDKAKELFPK